MATKIPFKKGGFTEGLASFIKSVVKKVTTRYNQTFLLEVFEKAAILTKEEFEAQVPEDRRMADIPTIEQYYHIFRKAVNPAAEFIPDLNVTQTKEVSDSYRTFSTKYEEDRKFIWMSLTEETEGYVDRTIYNDARAQYPVEFHACLEPEDICSMIRLYRNVCAGISSSELPINRLRKIALADFASSPKPVSAYVIQFFAWAAEAEEQGADVTNKTLKGIWRDQFLEDVKVYKGPFPFQEQPFSRYY